MDGFSWAFMNNQTIAGVFLIIAMTGSFAVLETNDRLTDLGYKEILNDPTLASANYFLLLNQSNQIEFLERASGSQSYALWRFKSDGSLEQYKDLVLGARCVWDVYGANGKVVAFTTKEILPHYDLRDETAEVSQKKAGTTGNLTIRTSLFPRQAKQEIRWAPALDNQSYELRQTCTSIGKVSSRTLHGSAVKFPSEITLQWAEVYDKVLNAKFTHTTVSNKFVLRFVSEKGAQLLDPTQTWANSTVCPRQFINLTSNTYQSLVNWEMNLKLRNPVTIAWRLNASSLFSLARDKNNMTIRNVSRVSDILEMQFLVDKWQLVMRNSTTAIKNCVLNGTIPNNTFSCSMNVTIVQMNATENVKMIIDPHNFSIVLNASGELNLTIRGRKNPLSSIDIIPAVVINGTNYECDDLAWMNSTYTKRYCVSMPNNPNATIRSRDLEIFRNNLSAIAAFSCSNTTFSPCDEAVMTLNSTDSDWREILFNITNMTTWGAGIASSGIIGATTKNLFWAQNTTAHYAPSNFNATPCIYFSNPAGGKSPNFVGTLVREFDSFEEGIIPFNANLFSVTSGTVGTNNTFPAKDGKQTMQFNSSGLDRVRTATTWGDQTTVVFFMHFFEQLTFIYAPGIGLADNANSGELAPSTAGAAPEPDSLTRYNAGTGAVNTTNATGWHTAKVTDIEAVTAGSLDFYLDGRRMFPDTTAVTGAGQVDIGESAVGEANFYRVDEYMGSRKSVV